jgi:hypothetical protein
MANWAWPEIMDEDSALDASHKAGWWAGVVGGLTGLVAVISLVAGTAVMGIGPAALFDAALFGIVAWRVWNGSRPWAVAGLALYLFEIGWNLTHHHGIGILTVIIILGLVNGVRGTFALHKYREEKTRMMQSQPLSQG